MKRARSINEIATDRLIALWREFYRKNPDKWQKVLDDAERARIFREKLRADMNED